MKMMQKRVVLLTAIVALFLAGLNTQAVHVPVLAAAGAVGQTVFAPAEAALEGAIADIQEGDAATRSGQQLNTIWRRVNKIPNIAQADQIFTQQEITAGPGVMIVGPGVYHLAENVTFSNQVAITIASDDVVLDLTGRSIDGQNRGGIAIQIKAGYKNVTIINGSIKRCICAGIFADGSGQPNEQSPYESITIKNILIADLGLCDIESTNPNEILSILDDLSDNSSFDAALEAGLGGQIDLLARAVGIFIDCARKVIIEECQVCNVQGDGFFLRHVTDAVVKESQAESNGADGFVFDTCDISTISSCKAERNGLHGFHELSSNGDNEYRLCTARQNGVHGFRIIGGGKIVEDCISNQNTLDGFYVVTPKNSTVDGSLDITFGTNGIVITDLGIASTAYAMALQKDGKIVATGIANNGANLDFATVRYNPDGSLDTSFNGTGLVVTDFGGSDQANAVAIQEDGKIVVAGYSDAAGSVEFALARYNVDGSLDPDFNQGSGMISTDINPFDDGAFSLAIQDDGKIVAAGSADVAGGNLDFAVLRYTPRGQLDTSFNGTGIVITDLGGNYEFISGIVLQPDGKIVAAGFSNAGGSLKFAVARYNIDGSLDTTFGGGTGFVLTPFAQDAQGQAVTLQKDGKIVVAGVTNVGISSTPYFALVRYNTDGSLDTSFNGTGIVENSFAGFPSEAFSVTIQEDGKINAIGVTRITGQNFVGLMRYTTEGSLDTGWNGGVGQSVLGTGSGNTQANAGLLDAQGKLLVAGDAGSPPGFFVARVNIFKRCSMIKDSTAQANGRDGFNLQDAYEVAVLGNQASCNTRNGFVASSPAANNLYNNLSYDNAANYFSVTDLTVKPDEISSYWANVDPDKSVFDCNLCSLVEVINSKIDVLHGMTSVMDSPIDSAIPCILETCSLAEVINDKVDIVQEIANTIESLVEAIDTRTQEIDSEIDALVPCIEHTCSIVDVIEDKVDAAISLAEVIDSNVDVIDRKVSVVDSKIDAITPCVNSTCSIVEAIDSKVDALQDTADTIESLVEAIDTRTQEIDSEIDALVPCIEYTCSIVDVIDNNVETIDSKVDVIIEKLIPCEHPIYQADIPYVITQPGIYCLAESVQNTGLNDFLISINSSDVVLDLGQHLMDGGTQDGLAQGAANGIVVEPGVQNIIIKNGTLSNFAEYAVYVGGALTTEQDPVVNVTIEDVQVVNISQFLPSSTDQIDLIDSALDSLSDDTGFDQILESSLGDQFTRIKTAAGIFVGYANTVSVARCIASHVQGDGLFLHYVQDCVIKDCQSERNGGNGFVFDNCDVSSVVRSNAEQNGFNGFYDVASNGDNSYADCTAKQNGEHGFRIIGGGKTIENCIANQNTLDGFYVVTPENSTEDGSLDITFGTGGETTIVSPGGDQLETAFAVAIQKDGKIITAGSSAGEEFALARQNSNGSLDTSFNPLGADPGTVTVSFPDSVGSQAYGVAIQEDGKIVAVGYVNTGDGLLFAIIRLNNDGSLDTSFNGTGQQIVSFGGSNEQARAVVLQQDGMIVAAGLTNAGDTQQFALARITATGGIDFQTTTIVDSSSEIAAIALQENGKIVVGGFAQLSTSQFALARYNTDGSLDTSFGVDGQVTTSFGSSDAFITGVAIQKDGKIVAAGYAGTDDNFNFALARYTIDGSLDVSFGTGGTVLTPGANDNQPGAVVLQKDGKIIAVGYQDNGGGALNFELIRYNTDGSPDTTFNSTVITDLVFVSEGFAAALQQDGKLVAAGFRSGDATVGFAINRYNIFSRCSTIRESIAQANGRDGFNLQSAFNVALLTSEASCNTRNGFVASSTTANNLYSNVSYDNTANYVSITDLTVKPDAFSSYWGNVDPDKSVFDCSLCSITEVLDSKIDSFNTQLSTIDSVLNTILGIVSTPPVLP